MRDLALFGIAVVVAFSPALTPQSWAAAQPKFKLTNLGILADGTYSAAYGINDKGQVVGDVGTQTGTIAFIWNPGGGMAQLSSLADAEESNAREINNSGAVVGWVRAPSGGGAFVWDQSNGMRVLDPSLADNDSQAYSINDEGYVVGAAGFGEVVQGFVWREDIGVNPIGDLPGSSFSRAYDINNSQVIAGSSHDFGRVFRWSEGTIEELQPLYSESNDRNAFGINDFGYVVGAGGNGTGAGVPILWSIDGSAHELPLATGALGGRAYAVNNSNWVVGRLDMESGFAGFLWTQQWGSILLESHLVNGDGWRIESVRDINELGQIVGAGKWNGREYAVLLTPVFGIVPEASTWAMMIVGFGLIGFAARCRSRSVYVGLADPCVGCRQKS